jgi:hypothetical protein
MLASAQVQQLVEKAKINRILYGSLLPLNNNKCYLNLLEINSVTVVVDDPAMGAVPVALGIINKCSANQACFMLKSSIMCGLFDIDDSS